MISMIQLLPNALLSMMPFHALLAQTDTDTTSSTGNPILLIVCFLIFLLIFLVAFVGFWKVFTKAGRPGWAIIIPIYNVYIMCKIAGRPGWWVLITPFVIPTIIICIDIAKRFGKGTGFGWGLALLGVIFFPILGFGSAQYQGSTAGA